ncbi:MAG: S8 family serine peptidase [Gloeobacteraceae cyanobacterium ES-bin-144]|nr:S8 family serine peptidase [Verrucomicrobiales bacterium]
MPPNSPAFRALPVLHALGLGLLMCAFTGHATAQVAPSFVEGEVIVTYRENTTLEAAKTNVGRRSMKFAKHFAWLSDKRKRVTGLVSSPNKSTADLIKELEADPAVLTAEPNYIRYVTGLQPNDTSYTSLCGLNNTGQTFNSTTGTSGKDISFVAAWNLARKTSNEVVVAVLDTGLDTTHPDIIPNLWINSGEIPGNNIDDDGNGKIDDINGYDFSGNDPDVSDSGDHGTHVAGTICAVGNNAFGVIGVNFKARVMVLKASNNGNSVSTAAEIDGLSYAAMMKTRGVNLVAINASFASGSPSAAESAAIQAAGNAGIVFCAAAGNDGLNNSTTAVYPANYGLSNMISVAASTQTDALASFSNYSSTKVDLAAPGENIFSLYPTWLRATASLSAGVTSYTTTGLLFSGYTPGITATLINCGNGNSGDQFPPSVQNNIALIQRGAQNFSLKITNAMNAGAIGAIIYNNVSGGPTAGTLQTNSNWIPTIGVSLADGNSLLTKIGTQVTLSNVFIPSTCYQFLNGTSMATPHVVGAVAFAAMNFPNETVAQRIARIVNNTTPVAALSGKVKSGGRLNLLKIIDTNSDGLPDWWTQDYFNTLTVNPNLDADGDGASNIQELYASTDPKNTNSKLAITQTAFIPNGPNKDFRITFFGAIGVAYQVEYNNSLNAASWTNLGPVLTGTGANLQVTDPSANNNPKRFYRARVIP